MDSPSSSRTVHLVDARGPDRRLADARIYRDCPPAELDVIESKWADARKRLATGDPDVRLAPLEHSHWDWRNKAQSVEAGIHMLVAVECEGEAQGVMAVLSESKHSRLSGEPIVYVDYLESAPWNLRLSTAAPRFLGVGTVLIEEAVRLSCDKGFGGRLGLHSLPQAETFYKSRCRMTELGQDILYFDLTYFEFTSRQAMDWLANVGGTI